MILEDSLMVSLKENTQAQKRMRRRQANTCMFHAQGTVVVRSNASVLQHDRKVNTCNMHLLCTRYVGEKRQTAARTRHAPCLLFTGI